MTADERAVVAMILALPDGPWDFAAGHRTAEGYHADLAAMAEHNARVYARKPSAKTKTQPPRGGECLIK